MYSEITKNLKEAGTYDPADDSFYQADCDRLNELRKDYHFHYSKDKLENDLKIEDEVLQILDDFPIGITICQNYKETTSGWTSRGGYDIESATILTYEKVGDNQWKTRWGIKDDADMKLSVLHNDSDMKLMEQAKKDQEEMKKDLHSYHRDYAPTPNVDRDNPHWDGNRYGI